LPAVKNAFDAPNLAMCGINRLEPHGKSPSIGLRIFEQRFFLFFEQWFLEGATSRFWNAARKIPNLITTSAGIFVQKKARQRTGGPNATRFFVRS